MMHTYVYKSELWITTEIVTNQSTLYFENDMYVRNKNYIGNSSIHFQTEHVISQASRVGFVASDDQISEAFPKGTMFGCWHKM